MTTIIQQSVTTDPLFFYLTQSADHITGLTGATATVTISKNGAAFAAPAGAVTEIANGWYQVAGNATDTGTLGTILLHATAASADPFDGKVAQVVAYNPRDSVRAGLTALPNAAANAVSGLPILDANSLIDVDVKRWLATAVTAATAGIPDTNVKNINNVVAATPGASGGMFIAGTNAATTITGSLTTTFTGNLTGSVASVTGNVGSVSGLTFTVANQVDANVLSLNGDGTSGANIAKTTRAICRATVGAASTTTSIVTSAFAPAGAAADQFKGRIVTFDATTSTTALRGQATDITASSNAATPTLTVTALTTAPSSGDTFSIT